MDAISAHAGDEEMEVSQSLARRRHRPRHAKVRSTSYRRGRISNPLAASDRLTRELATSDLDGDRLLLAGFSQGTMMALHVALRRPKRIAGVIGFSGMLVAPERLQDEICSRPPVLLVHGTADDVVPFRSLELAERALRAASVMVDTHVLHGIGHTVGPDGLSAAAAFAKRVLG